MATNKVRSSDCGFEIQGGAWETSYRCETNNVLRFITSSGANPYDITDKERLNGNHAMSVNTNNLQVSLNVQNNILITPPANNVSGVIVNGTSSSLTLNLSAGTTMQVTNMSNNYAPVRVLSSGTLNIKGSGKLIAQSTTIYAEAAIGGNVNENSGVINITENASVEASVAGSGAAIGAGGRSGDNSNGNTAGVITINTTGTVNAASNSVSASGYANTYGGATIGGASASGTGTVNGGYTVNIINGTVICTPPDSTYRQNVPSIGAAGTANPGGGTINITGGVVIAPNGIGNVYGSKTGGTQPRIKLTGGNIFTGDTPNIYPQPTSDGAVPAAANSVYPVYVQNEIQGSSGDNESTIDSVLTTKNNVYTANLVDLTSATYGSVTAKPISGVIYLPCTTAGQGHNGITITPDSPGEPIYPLQTLVVNQVMIYEDALAADENIIGTVSLTLAVNTNDIDIGTLNYTGTDWGAANVEATVITDSVTGWRLSFTTPNSSMTCATDPSAEIPTTASEGALLGHSWGYNTFGSGITPSSASSFKGIAANTNNAVSNGTTPTDASGVQTNLWFAARAGAQTLPCSYSNTVTLTAVADL
jgi:hypothetical protein